MPSKPGGGVKDKLAKKAKVGGTAQKKISKTTTHERVFNEVLTDEEIDILKETIKRVQMANSVEMSRTDKIHEKLVNEHRKRLKTANLGEGCCAHCGKMYLPLVNEKYICSICRKNIDKSCLSFHFNQVNLCHHCQGNTIAKATTGSWYMDCLKKGKIIGRIPDVHPLNALSSSLERIYRETHKSKSDDEQDDADQPIELDNSNKLESPMKRIGVAKIDPADIKSESEFNSVKNEDLSAAVYKNQSAAEETQSLFVARTYRKNPKAPASEFGAKSLLSVPGSNISGSSSALSNINDVNITGRIFVSVDFIHNQNKLRIFVHKAEEIAKVPEKSGSSLKLNEINEMKEPNCYVKTYLLPDKSSTGKRKTKTIKKTCNPKFMEEIKYSMTEGEVRTRTLNLSLWHTHGFSKKKFLGEFNLDFNQHKFDPEPIWYDLMPKYRSVYKVDETVDLGSINIAIKYEIEPGKAVGDLHVWVKNAKNLASFLNANQTNENMSPVAKIFMMDKEKKKTIKHKTKICNKTSNPEWNNAFVYEAIPRHEMSDRGLQIEVWNGDKRGIDNCLGFCRLNMGDGEDWKDAVKNEQLLWKTILIKHNVWAEAKIPLRLPTEKGINL